MSPSPKEKAFDATEEAPVRTNFKVMLAILTAGFLAGGIYWEMRAMRSDVDRMAVQQANEHEQRVQMQRDIQELSNLVRGQPTSGGKLSQNNRD